MKTTQKRDPSSTSAWRAYGFPILCALLWAGAVFHLSIGGGLSAGPVFGPGINQQTINNPSQDQLFASVEDELAPYVVPSHYFWLIPRSWFDPMIRNVASAHGVDPALVKAVVQAESAFDPLAVSEDGAKGLMQVLPETAARYRVRDLHNPYLNLQAGVGYLRSLLDEFDGDVRLAVAAYNAGENAVRRHRGVPPYPETRRYLDKVLGLYNAYRRQV